MFFLRRISLRCHHQMEDHRSERSKFVSFDQLNIRIVVHHPNKNPCAAELERCVQPKIGDETIEFRLRSSKQENPPETFHLEFLQTTSNVGKDFSASLEIPIEERERRKVRNDKSSSLLLLIKREKRFILVENITDQSTWRKTNEFLSFSH